MEEAERAARETGQAGALRLLGYTASYAGADLAADLRDISERAARNNPRDAVTGALLFDAGRFIQVIEGPTDRIEALLGRIRRDPRVGDLHLLFDAPMSGRSMDAWALWVGRTDGGQPIAEDELERFRDMYLRGFRLEALGFVTVLRALIEGMQSAPGGEGHP